MGNQEYLVDIPMCAYNHGRYIGQAIEGIINQETDFNYRLIIGEDCSKDNTRDIIKDYLQRYPDKIKVLFHEKNVGASENSRRLFHECTSKYIALCDGDDFWVHNQKLQKQISFLEANPDYSLSFHRVKAITDNGSDAVDVFELGDNFPRTTTVKDIARRNYIATASMVFRRFSYLAELPDWFFKLAMGDWALALLAADKGKISFLNEVMAVYRLHASGTWSSAHALRNYEKVTHARKILNQAFGYKYHNYFFYPEDMHNNEEKLLEHYRQHRKPLAYYRSFLKLLSYKKFVAKPWGYYFLLMKRYFIS